MAITEGQSDVVWFGDELAPVELQTGYYDVRQGPASFVIKASNPDTALKELGIYLAEVPNLAKDLITSSDIFIAPLPPEEAAIETAMEEKLVIYRAVKMVGFRESQKDSDLW